MTKRGRAVAWIAGALVAGFVASAVAAVPGGAQSGPAAGHFRAAERVAEVVTLATGVPISPLLGVSGFGAYRWWTTPAPARPALPWYARPWYWGTGLALALLFAVNTTLGAMVPGLSKPMDFVEQYENQVSAVLASPVVLFEVFRIVDSLPGFASAGEALPAGALAASGVAAVAALPVPLVWLAKLGTAALVLLAFAVVFLAFHTIQVLIALSPSNLLDILLRLFRLSILSLTAMAASVHPYVGAAFGLLVLLAASLVAGWAFRLTVFGWVVAGDIVRRRLAGESAPLAASAPAGSASPALAKPGRESTMRKTSKRTIGPASTAETWFSYCSTKSIGFERPGNMAPRVVLTAKSSASASPVPQYHGCAYHGSAGRAGAGVVHHR